MWLPPYHRSFVFPVWLWRVWRTTRGYLMPHRLRVFIYRAWNEWRWNNGHEY